MRINMKHIALVAAIAILPLAGCEPKVPSPMSGRPVSIEQAQLDLSTLQKREAEEAKRDAELRAVELRRAQREAERAIKRADASHEASVDEIADAHAEAVETASVKYAGLSDARRRAMEDIAASTNAAIADAQAKAGAWSNAFATVGGIAQSSGIPGVSSAGALLVGLGGLLFGAKRHADAKAEKAASEAHDDAWEEKAKEAAAQQAMVAQHVMAALAGFGVKMPGGGGSQ